MKLPKKLGNILLAIYLILAGLTAFHVSFPYMEVVMAVCAIIAGVLLLLGK